MIYRPPQIPIAKKVFVLNGNNHFIHVNNLVDLPAGQKSLSPRRRRLFLDSSDDEAPTVAAVGHQRAFSPHSFCREGAEVAVWRCYRISIFGGGV